jgi:hypothetical protein
MRVLRQTDRARLANALKPCGDVDPVSHEIVVAFLDHVAQMNADAELNPALRRQARVALDHAVLHLDGAAHGVDDAAKLDEASIPSPLDDAAVMGGDGGIDQIAAQAPKPRQRAILIRPREPAVADDIRDQDRSDLRIPPLRTPLGIIQNSVKASPYPPAECAAYLKNAGYA